MSVSVRDAQSWEILLKLAFFPSNSVTVTQTFYRYYFNWLSVESNGFCERSLNATGSCLEFKRKAREIQVSPVFEHNHHLHHDASCNNNCLRISRNSKATHFANEIYEKLYKHCLTFSSGYGAVFTGNNILLFTVFL